MFTVETDIHECLEHDTHILFSCEPRLPVLIVCDHASNYIPPDFAGLGMSERDRRRMSIAVSAIRTTARPVPR